MAIVRCAAGLHFYDDVKFDKCPHCTEENAKDNQYENDINEMATTHMKDSDSVDINNVSLKAGQMPGRNHYDIYGVDSDLTVAYYSEKKGNDLITGWLVCIDGPEKGRDYRIYHGTNKFGRGQDMDINVVDDISISRNTHLRIVYEMKESKYYIVPANGALSYLNGKLVTTPNELRCGDVIKAGRSSFEFVPFFKEGRSWNDINEKYRMEKKDEK